MKTLLMGPNQNLAGAGRRGRCLPRIWGARGLCWLLLAGMGWGGAPAVNAAPLRFDVFDVFVGYDAVVPQGSWFPVVCEIENKGPSLQGVFELSTGFQNQVRRLPLELPTGTFKRFVIPVFAPGRGTYGWEARLVDEKGRVRAEGMVRQVRQHYLHHLPLLGALSRSPTGRPVLPGPTDNNAREFQLEVARLQPDLLPDNPIALEGLTALYLNSELATEDRLRVNQVNALLAWLHGGGHLIVAVEQLAQVHGTEWLRRLLPCDLTGAATVQPHPALPVWLSSDQRIDGKTYVYEPPESSSAASAKKPRSSTVREPGPPLKNPFSTLPGDAAFEGAVLRIATATLRDGRVAVGTEAEPLIITARRGRGQITVLTFSPEREPFLSWKNRPYFWAKVANVPVEVLPPNWRGHQYGLSLDGVFGAMIETKQVRKLPVEWLLVLLIGYLVVIGPLDRYWLKKIGRQMLTWITFPAYVVFFSLLIYFIGYKLRAGVTEWNELHVVDVVPVGAQADLRGRTFASIYSPANARYPLACELPFAALRGEMHGQFGVGGESSTATVEQRGNHFAAEIFVPVWTSQLYVNDWWNRAPPPLHLRVTRRGPGYMVDVDNHLNRPLTETRLVLAGQVFELGEVPAGKKGAFALPASGKSLHEFVRGYGQSFETAVYQRQRAFGDDRPVIWNLPLSSMVASFITHTPETGARNRFQAPPGFDLTPLVERGDAVLLAWSHDYAPVKPFNAFTPRLSKRHTLWRVATIVE